MTVRPVTERDTDAWATMRAELWADSTVEEHRSEVVALLADSSDDSTAFVALDLEGKAIGFAETHCGTIM